MNDLPNELRDLDRGLRSVRFVPRSSFAPELFGRLRRGDQPNMSAPPRPLRLLAAAAVAALVIGGGLAVRSSRQGFEAAPITVDRCCYDLDGGGDSDDGVVVLAERDARVHRLRVYEDIDGSLSFTPADVVRLDRGSDLVVHGEGGEALVTIKQCCSDFDGGGPDDDGLLIIGVPPDKVVMAAIYETSSTSGSSGSHQTGWPLR